MNTTDISQNANNANLYISHTNDYSHYRHCQTKTIALNNSDIIQFPTQAKASHNTRLGWICNLSARYVFSQPHHEYLQIKPSKKHSQFELICSLLKANTCRVIYFDDQLTKNQLALIRERHISSKTELVHAKVTFLLAKKVSSSFA
jgi:hypothetical protein